MSASNETETVRACPHGHISLTRNSETGAGGFNGRPAKTVFYCKTCANKHSGGGRVNPHYERHELTTKERKVNPQLDYDTSLGYVWSPSHDE